LDSARQKCFIACSENDDHDAPTLPDNTLKLIDVKDVLFFNSDEKYTRVVTATEEALIRKPLRELLDELDLEQFWQIHRGTIVNVSAIAGVTRDFRGDATVKVKGHNEALKVSRPFSHLFKQM
jgi:DNA-binding LytR/AlgR family response regulator